MLEQVAKENEDAERQTIREENDSQAGYEDFVKNTHKSIALMSKQLVDDKEVESKEEKKEVEDKQDVRLTVKDILSLADVSKTLHMSCDETVNHFSETQKTRDEEMTALKEA